MQRYQEVPPHPALAGHVACLWSSHALPDGEPVRTRILPDNCIDILWQDRAAFGFVAGMMSRAHRVETSEPVLTVAVRFLPGAARAFFDLPLHTLQDEHPALDDLWPRVEDLAGTLGVSRQHLALQFREYVGLNAKTFAMVRRFRQASAAVRRQRAEHIDWAGLAGECGYYDQSHLIHAFQLFAGETPEAFARPRPRMP